ncbi:YveK family protein [Latilactobacillus graminis]|uniref:YveK family protein n=1 Tax=Latilactobacillus graminis TaxID=60519 RepID=UPI00070CBF78|nr:Wzz/FepE/Etk N-terminal domain-containing protein [Latilactobacillus graminis]
MLNEQLFIAKLIKNLQQKLIIVLLIIIVSIGGTFLLKTQIQKPAYTSEGRILVNLQAKQTGQGLSTDDLKTNIQLMNTYSEIIKSSKMIKLVRQEVKIKHLSIEDIQKRTNVTSNNNSLIIDINYTSEHAHQTALVSAAMVKVVKHEIPKLFPNVAISIIEQSSEPQRASAVESIVMAGLIGLLVSLLYVVTISLGNQKIDFKADLTSLGITYLGRQKI